MAIETAFIAHPGEGSHADQSVAEHLLGVAQLARKAAAKVGMPDVGELIGLLHDLGKYSAEFQSYLRSAAGRINADEDGYIDSESHRGRIDHSTAGAQLVWNTLKDRGPKGRLVGQMLALCVASHHSGLIDCVSPEDEIGAPSTFERRMFKPYERTHFDEVIEKADQQIMARISELLASESVTNSVFDHLSRVISHELGRPGADQSAPAIPFQFGLAVRYLFSCLIDADRQDTADFEKRKAAAHRQHGQYVSWGILRERLEVKLRKMSAADPIGQLRSKVSESCLARGADPTGLFTLTVPTGGGKTLASLRFGLKHAEAHGLERIVYVIPYTSIIDQNAAVVRDILESATEDLFGSVVLEHHSNLTPDKNLWRAKTLSENWDAPIVFTTSVQVLEAMFSGGTRGVRRLHQLTKSVLIFDEIQTLPIRCVHMFCNALNYLVKVCGSTAVLCTATQPLLGELKDRTSGALDIAPSSEIIPDVPGLFKRLRRVEIVDRQRPGGWTAEEIAELATSQAAELGDCLVIVNTKRAARAVYEAARRLGVQCAHLSTAMCPAHRMSVLSDVKKKLGREKFVCVSTQLIEAGVDIDFSTVVRMIAGLDSIAQAAGRCNRNGRAVFGRTYIVNADWEKIDSLEDIRIGAEMTRRLLDEFNRDPSALGGDLLSPESMRRYFNYYFFDRAERMCYPVAAERFGRDDTLLSLLGENRNSVSADLPLRSAFKTGGKVFEAIDAPTRGVIVPYGQFGRELVADLYAAFDLTLQYGLLKLAQRYTVNVFPGLLHNLSEIGALQEVQHDTGLLVLDERYYSEEFGLSEEAVNALSDTIF